MSESKHDIYEAVRAQIVHEDDLTNQRFTWFLTSNGFLFTGFFVIAANIDHFKFAPLYLAIFMSLICITGIVFCFIINREIGKNVNAYQFLRDFWYGKFPSEGKDDRNNKIEENKEKEYPDVHHTSAKIKFSDSIKIMSRFLITIWLIFLSISWLITFTLEDDAPKANNSKSYKIMRRATLGVDTTVYRDTLEVPVR